MPGVAVLRPYEDNSTAATGAANHALVRADEKRETVNGALLARRFRGPVVVHFARCQIVIAIGTEMHAHATDVSSAMEPNITS